MATIQALNEAPTVLANGANPLQIYLNQKAYAQRNQYNQDRLAYQAQQAREKGFNDLMKMDLTKPGSFQRENSIQEENDYRKKIVDAYYKDPTISPSEMRFNTANDRAEVERKRAKRMEIGDTIKNVTDVARKDKNIDPTALANVVMREHTDYNPENGNLTPKQVDEIDKEKIAESVNHPSVYKADSAIIDFANSLKGGISEGRVSPEFATALGTAREGIFGKMKFYQTDTNGQPLRDEKGNLVPGISQNLIDYVKEANPKIEQKYLWDIAKQQHAAAGGNPDDLQGIDKIYESIAHNPDQKEKFQPLIDQRIKQALGVHQKLENVTRIQRTGTFQKRSNNSGEFDNSTSSFTEGDQLKDWSNVDESKGEDVIGYKNQDIGFTGSDKYIQFSPTKNGEKNAYGRFTGFRTNPATGAKEMVMAQKSTDNNGQIAEVPTYVPYDESALAHVRNGLTKKSDQEKFDKTKAKFNEDFKNREEYILDKPKLEKDVKSVEQYYELNKDKVGDEEFNNGFKSLLNDIGIDTETGSENKWFTADKLKIGNEEVKVTDKNKLKQVLYNAQKGRYKKLKEKQSSKKTFDPNNPL